jgi:hypothetical protein
VYLEGLIMLKLNGVDIPTKNMGMRKEEII